MWRKRRIVEIQPDEIFLDSSNLPSLDSARLEGRMERPIASGPLIGIGVVFMICLLFFVGRAFSLQVVEGETYAQISRENRLAREVVFAPRGRILDRNGVPIAWNDAQTASTTDEVVETFPRRRYIGAGLAHVLGFVRYPSKDDKGIWWNEEYEGVSGAELVYDHELRGENGSVLVERDARGEIQREHIVIPAKEGTDITLAVDAKIQQKLHEVLSAHASNNNFRGGAAVIMDVRTGELLALTSFPEYDNYAFSEGDSALIDAANTDPFTPLLNRAVAGLYTPGSIVKPIFAVAALQEGIISPQKEILSTGALTVPNPYNPSRPSVFRDWRAHGYTDMRRAIAVSSDVYFYTIGGGFGGQAGLGITRIDDYARRFGLGSLSGVALGGEQAGVIPTPEWKAEMFDGDEWRLGDTFITAIGQFGFQITPLQAVRFTAGLAGGQLLTPRLTTGPAIASPIGIDEAHLEVAREGMRAAVVEGGTAAALNLSGMEIAAKTGTAEVGERNQFMNSWVIGFWPASSPKYAFAVVLERAPAGTLSGASPGMRPFFDWLVREAPQYAE